MAISESMKIQPGLQPGKTPKSPRSKGDGADFKDALKGQLEQAKGLGSQHNQTQNLTFSNHAIERMKLRGIQLGPDQLTQIENAVQKASAKGAKETLVVGDQAAFIVSVKNNKVVTAMDSQSLRDNVFTNIDSTVII